MFDGKSSVKHDMKEKHNTGKKCVVLMCPYNTGTHQHNVNPNMAKGDRQKDSWGCKWLITVNAPTLTALFMTCKLSEMPCEVIAYKMGYEVGATGNLHKHLYVVFNRSWRKSSLIKRFLGCQIDLVTSGTEATVIDYIGGEKKSEEKGSSVLWVDIAGDIQSSQGQRNDISATDAVLWQIKDAIDSGANMREVWGNFFPYMVRYGSGVTMYHDRFTGRKVPEEEILATAIVVQKTD